MNWGGGGVGGGGGGGWGRGGVLTVCPLCVLLSWFVTVVRKQKPKLRGIVSTGLALRIFLFTCPVLKKIKK